MAASTWTAQLNLGIALANLGSAEEAAEHGKQALASGCGKAMLLPRFRELDAVLMSRYAKEPAAVEFHERYEAVTSQFGARAGI
jgi:hypothetical protein